MPRIATAILLGLCSLWSLLAAMFAWGGFMKSGFDVVLLAVAAAFLAFAGAAWWVFSRRRHGLALAIGAAPVVGSVVALSTMQLRLF